MKKSLLFLLIIIAAFSGRLQAQVQSVTTPAVIPLPLNVKPTPGSFRLSSHVIIIPDAGNTELLKLGQVLSGYLHQQTGYNLLVKAGSGIKGASAILLTLKGAPDTLGNEGYTLSIKPGTITIKANKSAGLFYGMQTIRQLLPVNSNANATIACIEITDKPRFKWRGLMLDVGRYFYSVDFIKKYLDYMAMYKLNTFHWHLTEDHGWRIEIKKYPKLTQIGAWRAGTQYDRSANQVDKNGHGGYYTQDQVREIVAYARQRYIDVVPEIEMPGHSLAALVAYPELSCTGGPFKMPLQWAIQQDVYCAGNEQTFKFLQDVLTEIVPLFPSPYLHIGGDECPKDRWKSCPKCQARIKAEGLKDEHELQSYFIKRIENFLLTKNKRIIGWDEILEGGLAPNATVMSWRGITGGIEAAKQRHDVIMSPGEYLYFDHYQGEPYLEPVAIGGFLPLQKVYNYEPVPAALSVAEGAYIKGVQANIWSEYIHSPQKVAYMTFPRAAAMAEIAWTPARLKNWDSFKKRMETEYRRYERLDIPYSKSAYQVTLHLVTDTLNNRLSVSLSTDSYRPEIRYTTDGTEPVPASPLYSKPFQRALPVIIKAANFIKGKQVSPVSVSSVNPQNAAFQTQR